ncbi:MASE1 domain-containing protein [Advenella mimigardefordensis]|uniref:Putative integral membrane sensory MASE1 domain-containing protein n=1 Tax=Advenella mimigardefordensis (strain DSM 17166 / LMG 22922 / DPN7) TaxID=1247726 RepID=W0PFA9_ADVMD|nr:putative integral membrane sensory MASE1 domain-containing protein [Advenella mimigardefordensis DPN7]
MPVFESKLRAVVSVLGWAVLYWVAAYISLMLDDPLSHVGFVWFPAGIGVAAFLISEYRRWPWLVAAFFVAHVIADINFEHDIPIAVALAIITVASDMFTAWVVCRYAQNKDGLQIILRWIVATFVISAIAAVLSAGWLTLFDHTPFDELVWVWWGAHVSGVLYLTAVVMGLRGYQLGNANTGTRAVLVGVVAVLLMAICAWLIFDAEQLDMTRSQVPWRATLIFALTGVPVALAVVAAIACGNRMGSLALLSLGAIVIYHSSEGTGPFFLKSLRPGESLLLAQCYLVATALLIVFLRVFTQTVKRYGVVQEQRQETAFMYRLDASSGHMDWDGCIHEMLGTDQETMSSTTQILAMAHPDDRAVLAAMLAPGDDKPGIEQSAAEFRLKSSATDWVRIRTTAPVLIGGPDSPILVGTWLVGQGGQS